LEWVKSSHTEETNEILKPISPTTTKKESEIIKDDSIDINLLSLNELLGLSESNKEIKQRVETIFQNITTDLQSMARKSSKPDFKKLFELLALKYSHDFIIEGKFSQVAEDIIYKMEFKPQEDFNKDNPINTVQDNINKFSKSVRASFEALKINKFSSYKKAISLLTSINNNGGINSFLSKINIPNSDVLSFGAHPYNGNGEFKNAYIFDIGDAERAIIHRVTGQVLFIGNPFYHK
jgi:hypothetical protein